MNPTPCDPSIQIVFLHLEPSPILEACIREDVTKLKAASERITHCHVSISKVDHRHHHGSPFEIRIEMAIPRGPLVLRHRSTPGEDAYSAVSAAFHVMRRQIDSHVRRLRGEVKRHGAKAERQLA